MGTQISDVLDMALVSIQDYKLNDLYNKSEQHTEWKNYLSGFLGLAVADFDNCNQSLSYNLESGYFDSNLTTQEKMIISRWIVYEWFVREVNNVLQFNHTLTDNDFKHYSEAQNLQAKMEYKDRTREVVMQMMVDYEKNSIDYKEWANGNFGI